MEVGKIGMRGCGDDKLRGALGVDARAGFANDGQVLGEFGVAAAGQNGNKWLSGIEVVAAAKFFVGLRGVDGTDKRMADEFRGDTGIAEESFLERKDAESLRETSADNADAPRSPSPKLRTDVIDVANAEGAELAREAKMKAGEIGEDGQRRLAAVGFRDEAAHGANERRKMAESFRDADDGDFGVVGDDVNARGAHLRAAHAKERDVHAFLQSRGETRGVHVPGSFAGGDEERNWRHARVGGAQSVAG